MKNDKKNMDLDQLLATIEHAGRDSRRQQELAAIIDSLAAAEAPKKRGLWWWSSRIAAAACVTFFVTTAIRIWFIPTGPAGNGAPIVAEMTTPDKPSATATDTAVVPTVSHRTVRHTPKAELAAPETATDGLYAETTTEAETVETDTAEAPYYIIIDDFAPDTELIANNGVTEQTATGEPITTAAVANNDAATKPSEPQRRKLFGGFLRRSEPSRMEGTTLALLQF